MRVTLENETGKSNRRLVLSSGQFMRIGSRAAALTGDEDPFMSSLHFLIECKADRCRIADMGSRNGTFVNGARITDSVLCHGDEIVAGQTRFRVHIDMEEDGGPTPRRPTEHFTNAFGDETLVLHREPKDLREVLCGNPEEHLYALLDAARDRRIQQLLLEASNQYQSLREGDTQDEGNGALYLVELREDSPLLDTLIHEGWGQNWGIYLTSTKDFQDVHGHFRAWIAGAEEDTNDLQLSDRRALRIFLSTCTASDCEKFLGPVQHLLVERDDGSAVLRFSAAAAKAPEEIKVKKPAMPPAEPRLNNL